jgi:hypothetical protein
MSSNAITVKGLPTGSPLFIHPLFGGTTESWFSGIVGGLHPHEVCSTR